MELLIRINNRSAAADDAKLGDVVAVCPDGWPWSAAEMANPDWVVIQTQITQAEADALTAPRIDPVTMKLTYRRNYAVTSLPAKPQPSRVMVVPVAAFRTRFGLK